MVFEATPVGDVVEQDGDPVLLGLADPQGMHVEPAPMATAPLSNRTGRPVRATSP